MFILILNLLLLGNPVELKSDGAALFHLIDGRVQTDGTILMFTENKLYHFENDGTLIRHLGGNGDGPGKFRSVWYSAWTGTHYLAMDGRRIDISVFDEKGNFLNRDSFWGYAIQVADGKVYAASYEPFGQEDITIKPLGEVGLNEDHRLTFKAPMFHFVRKEIFDFLMNNKRFFITGDGRQLYVMDEVRPEVTVYDKGYNKVDTIYLNIKDYVEPTGVSKPGTPSKESRRKRRALSWFRMLKKVPGGFFASLWMPVPGVPDSTQITNQLLDECGRHMPMPFEIKGVVIGVHDGVIYSVSEEEGLQYLLHKYPIRSGGK